MLFVPYLRFHILFKFGQLCGRLLRKKLLIRPTICLDTSSKQCFFLLI